MQLFILENRLLMVYHKEDFKQGMLWEREGNASILCDLKDKETIMGGRFQSSGRFLDPNFIACNVLGPQTLD